MPAQITAHGREPARSVDVPSAQLPANADAAHALQFAIRQRLRAGILPLALGVVLMAVGACTVALWVVRLSREPALISFGVVGLLYGLRLAATSELSRWLVDLSPLAWGWLEASLTYVIPVPWGLFFEQVAGRGWRSSIRRVWQVSLAYAVIGLAGDLVAAEPGCMQG